MGACLFPPPRPSFTTPGDVAINASGMTGIGSSADKPDASPGDERGFRYVWFIAGSLGKPRGERAAGEGGKELSKVWSQVNPVLACGGGEGWGQVLWRSCPTGAKELGFLPQNWSLAKGEGPWVWVTSSSRLWANTVATVEQVGHLAVSMWGAPREPRCPDFTAHFRFRRQHQPPTLPLKVFGRIPCEMGLQILFGSDH